MHVTKEQIIVDADKALTTIHHTVDEKITNNAGYCSQIVNETIRQANGTPISMFKISASFISYINAFKY